MPSFLWLDRLDAIAPVFIEAAVRGAIVLLIALGISHLMRRGTAAARHLVWVGAIVVQLALPLFALWGPRWEVGVPRPVAAVLPVPLTPAPAVSRTERSERPALRPDGREGPVPVVLHAPAKVTASQSPSVSAAVTSAPAPLRGGSRTTRSTAPTSVAAAATPAGSTFCCRTMAHGASARLSWASWAARGSASRPRTRIARSASAAARKSARPSARPSASASSASATSTFPQIAASSRRAP